MGLTVDTDIDLLEDLFGKTVGKLQEDIEIGDDEITGTLLYVDDYTGFSEDTELQSGNYLAIHVSVPDVEDVEINVSLTDPVEVDENGIAVLRIADKTSQTVTVVASKEGCESVTKVYDLNGLTCNDS